MSDAPEQGSLPQEFEKHRAELIRQAQAILSSREDAEDVVQETCCDALRQPEELCSADSAAAWLRSLNRCNALNRLRERKSTSAKHESKLELAPDRTFTTGGFSLLELRDAVSSAMRSLPPNLRQVVELRFFKHRSYKQIAQELNVPIGNVSGLLMDAIVRLHPRLQAQLGCKSSVSTSRHTQSSLPVDPPNAAESAKEQAQ